MYGRDYDGKELNFEASGGLWHSSLVMQDKETDSYWSIMTGEALSGPFKGTRMDELPSGRKVQWKEWVAEHPDTLVLSVIDEKSGEAIEHVAHNPYEKYFGSDEGFRGSEAVDDRLPTKAPVFAFELGDTPYAAPFGGFQGSGASFDDGGRAVFLYRPDGVQIFHSSAAFVAESGGFEQQGDSWRHQPSGALFDPESGRFADGAGDAVQPLGGFDTFWFNWSMVHDQSEILN